MSVTPPLDSATTPSGRLPGAAWLPLLLVAALAFISSGALALAPVEQSRVDVSWPKAGGEVQSTALVLSNQTPHTLDVTFTGAAAVAAAANGGTVFATMDPADPTSGTAGLSVTAARGLLKVATAGKTWASSYTPSDTFAIASSIHGFEVSRNGAVAFSADVMPPQVDGLLTGATGVGADELHASLQVVDDPNDRATALKSVLFVIALLLIVATLVLIAVDDRRRQTATRKQAIREPRAHWALRALRTLTPADAVFVVFIIAWALVGATTDDDGYYAAIGYNASEAGYVGQYYQLFNQSFTPFTWLWQFFDAWSHAFGRSPFVLRLPAVGAAIIAWFIIRTLLNRLLVRTRGLRAEGARVLLAVISLVWWGAYAIGVRPEPIAAAAAVIAVALLTRAYDTRRLLPAAFAVAVAAISFAAHPIGIVAAAPVIVSIPMLWRIAREGSAIGVAVARTVAVASAAAIALVLAFSGGSLTDMLTGSRRFALVEEPLTWLDEWRRYGLLLADIPMGSYARRSVVLVGLVLLLWFIVFVLWSRRVAPFSSPVPLSLIGWSFALAFVLMWITTSKWTHHFGSLSALGPLFIVAMAVVVPQLVRTHLVDARLPAWLAPTAVVSLVPPMLVSIRGVDQWAYEWGEGLARPARPEVAGIGMGNYVIWGLGIVVLIVAGCLWARRRDGSPNGASALVAIPALVSVFFAAIGGYMYVSFIGMALPDQGFTTGGATARDPWGTQCLPDKAIDLWDAAGGSPLATVAGEPAAAGFAPLSAGDQSRPKAAADLPIWTTQDEPDGTGRLQTAWYGVPRLSADQKIGVLASGDFLSRTVGLLTAEFRVDGGTPQTVAVGADGNRVGWSTMIVPVPAALADKPGVEVRLVAVDLTAVPGQSVSVSAPTLIRPVTMDEVSSPGDPTAVGWTQSFWFACDRPMAIARGVIEPPVFATTFGANGIDNIWVPQRGGSLAGVSRLATVNTPTATMVDSGVNARIRVHLFDYRVAADAYDLTQTWVTTPGWRSAFDPPSQLVPAS